MTTDVSVIIVNYNTKDLTVNCIKSVYGSETDYSYEIILVDNGSTDGSPQVIKELFPDVKIVENGENMGYARANNKAATLAAGRYLYLLNSDTEIEKDVIEKVVSFGDKNNDTGIIGTKVVFPDGTLQKNYYQFPTLLSELIFFTLGIIKTRNWKLFNLNKYPDNTTDRAFEVDVISGCSLFVKRQIFERTGLFNEDFFMYYEDGEFCYRAKRQGLKNVYLPTAKITHIHMGSADRNSRDFSLLVSSFKGACIYFRCVKNLLYAGAFRLLCFFLWFHELMIFRLLSLFTKNQKVRTKITMLQALLNQ